MNLHNAIVFLCKKVNSYPWLSLVAWKYLKENINCDFNINAYQTYANGGGVGNSLLKPTFPKSQ